MSTSPERDPNTPAGQPRGRTGSEPANALSALRFRLVLAVGGALLTLVLGIGALAGADGRTWLVVLGVILLAAALAGVVDAVVVLRRLSASRRPDA